MKVKKPNFKDTDNLLEETVSKTLSKKKKKVGSTKKIAKNLEKFYKL